MTHSISREHEKTSTIDLEKQSSHESHESPHNSQEAFKTQDAFVCDTFLGAAIEPVATHQSRISTTTRSVLSRFRTRDTIPLTPPPDGGLQAWIMVAMAFIVNLNTWGFANTFGVFQTFYVNNLEIGARSQVSWIGSLHIFFVFAIGTFSGRATDAGFFKPVFWTGSAIYCLGLLLLSFCDKYWQVFLCHSLIVGIGAGMAFVPSLTVMASYFSHAKRPIALAFVVCGSSVGGILFPVVADRMLGRYGFGWTLRTIFFIQAFFAIVSCVLLKPRIPPRKAGPLIEWSAWTEAPYTLYLIGIFFAFLAMYIGFFYIGSYGRDVLGVSQSTGIQLLLIMNAVGLVGRLIPGFIASKFTGPLNLIIPYAAAACATFWSWIAVHDSAGLWVWAVMQGLASAGIQGLFPVVLTSLTDDPKKMGVRSGMGFTMAGLAVLIGPPIAGALVEAMKGSYLGLQTLGAASLVVSLCFLILSRWVRTGFQLRVKV